MPYHVSGLRFTVSVISGDASRVPVFGRKPSALDPVFLAWFKAPPAAQLLIPTAYGKEKGVLGSPITHFSPEQ